MRGVRRRPSWVRRGDDGASNLESGVATLAGERTACAGRAGFELHERPHGRACAQWRPGAGRGGTTVAAADARLRASRRGLGRHSIDLPPPIEVRRIVETLHRPDDVLL